MIIFMCIFYHKNTKKTTLLYPKELLNSTNNLLPINQEFHENESILMQAMIYTTDEKYSSAINHFLYLIVCRTLVRLICASFRIKFSTN